MSYIALAYYFFTPIADPAQEVVEHKNFFKDKDAVGRIYLSQEGMNGQMSAEEGVAESFKEWLISRFGPIDFKIHKTQGHIFPRMTVKVRKQLVALDEGVNLEERGEYVSPQKWREMLESGEEYFLLDVRNDYEWKVGHFVGATLPTLSQFRDFPSYADELAETKDPQKTKVMMYCTGGIRCELYSALLKKRGFTTVYQLQGGVIAYGEQEGDAHWEGKLFVFDDRLAIPLGERKENIIAQCHHCGSPSDTYYNCANMDCNELFLSCESCVAKQLGCCKAACQVAPRVRPYERAHGNRPFRKKHLLNIV